MNPMVVKPGYRFHYDEYGHPAMTGQANDNNNWGAIYVCDPFTWVR